MPEHKETSIQQDSTLKSLCRSVLKRGFRKLVYFYLVDFVFITPKETRFMGCIVRLFLYKNKSSYLRQKDGFFPSFSLHPDVEFNNYNSVFV